MKLKKSYFAVPGMTLLLVLGACQGGDDALQAETNASHQEQKSDEGANSKTDNPEDNQAESTENNSNEEKQADSDGANNADAATEGKNTDSEEASNSNINETDYSSEQEAVNAIENYEEVEQTNTDLGHGIEALSEGAAGHNYISWNEGKWLIRVDAPTNPENATGNYEDGEELAQAVVNYLETNSLPAPDQRGVIEINDSEDHPGTVIRWQQGSTVYEIDENTDNPIDALQTAVDNAS